MPAAHCSMHAQTHTNMLRQLLLLLPPHAAHLLKKAATSWLPNASKSSAKPMTGRR